MKKKRYNTEQLMKILRESEGSKSALEVCRDYEISEQTLYRWKRKYAGMGVHDAKRLKELEEENRRLKKLVAERDLHIDVLKEVTQKMVGPARRRQAIEHVLDLGMCSARLTCKWMGLSRSARYRPLKSKS
ncbi:MAG: putative transposase [Candidatus Pelagisphaera sp.]|jgi:putative transposase